MDNFDVSEMSTALKDVTNEQNNKNPEAATIAREKGWAAPEGYDYTKYTAEPLPKPAEEQEQGEQGELPEWAAKAAKYEWKDEFGDVGPHIPELEEMLFRSEFINRAGLKLGK